MKIRTDREDEFSEVFIMFLRVFDGFGNSFKFIGSYSRVGFILLINYSARSN